MTASTILQPLYYSLDLLGLNSAKKLDMKQGNNKIDN